MVGFELQLKGIALEKSNAAETKNLATISDMAAGIPGQVVSHVFLLRDAKVENLSFLPSKTL